MDESISRRADEATIDVSVIIPTYREAENLRVLLPRLESVLSGMQRNHEILVVDDRSEDGTDGVVGQMADQIPVRLIVRTGLRDLSLAVLDGLRAACGRLLVVMDADLSHPPESIPTLLDALEGDAADLVIGSRYAAGGRTEDWGGWRQWNSRVATWLCRPLAGGVRDPMAGFFALRRATFLQGDRLDPIGYKIGLELICRCPCRNVVEVPITFRDRAAGCSKLNFEQQRRYLLHLSRLYRDCRPALGLVMRPLLWAMRGGLAAAQHIRARRRSEQS